MLFATIDQFFRKTDQMGIFTSAIIDKCRLATAVYMDADNVSIRGWTFLFDTPHYGQCGAIFWLDCEPYWKIRDGRLMIASDDGRLTMDLAPTVDDRWKGGLVGT